MIVITVNAEVIPPSVPKDVYHFLFEYMHGDADHSEREWVEVKPEDLPKMVQLLEEMNSYPRWKEPDRNEQWDAYPTLEYFFPREETPRDVTCDEYYVRISFEWQAFYYDKDGGKHSVIVTHTPDPLTK